MRTRSASRTTFYTRHRVAEEHSSMSSPALSLVSFIIGSFRSRSQSFTSSYLRQIWKMRVMMISVRLCRTRKDVRLSCMQLASREARARRSSSCWSNRRPHWDDRLMASVVTSTLFLFTAEKIKFSDFSWLQTVKLLFLPMRGFFKFFTAQI